VTLTQLSKSSHHRRRAPSEISDGRASFLPIVGGFNFNQHCPHNEPVSQPPFWILSMVGPDATHPMTVIPTIYRVLGYDEAATLDN